MYATIDELSDEPVSVTPEGERIRIRYGRGAALSLDRTEAVDLAAALAEVLSVPADSADGGDRRA